MSTTVRQPRKWRLMKAIPITSIIHAIVQIAMIGIPNSIMTAYAWLTALLSP